MTLFLEREQGFNDHRIRRKREEASEVARSVQEIRIARGRMSRSREPMLQH
jgi:hypothetical protein